jgi:hypothetical protein
MPYRLDNTLFSSEFPNFINVARLLPSETWPSVTIPDGNTNNYTLSAPITLAGNATFNDVYVYSPALDSKVKIVSNTSIDDIWQYVSSETVQNQVTFTSNTLTFEISVSNFTGASITVPSFTYLLEILSYSLPW